MLVIWADLNMTALESNYKGNVNLGIVDIPGTCMASDYIKFTNAMKSEELEEYDDFSAFSG